MWETLEACKVVEYSNGYAMVQCPFPASNWSDTFHALAQYAAVDPRHKGRGDPVREPSLSDQSTKEGPNGNTQHETTPTATQLLDQVAMYQEIWSSPHRPPLDLLPRPYRAPETHVFHRPHRDKLALSDQAGSTLS